MNFDNPVRPLDKGISKVLLLSLAIILIAIGVAVFSFTYLLATAELPTTVFGMVLVWIGSIVFFYAMITEEHTMKELFLRQSYFFTGLLVMILGVFFISLAGLYTGSDSLNSAEFGVLLIIAGGGVTLLSAQNTFDYSKQSALFAFVAGVMLILGGLMAKSMNIAYAGIFIIVLSGLWLGLRDTYAQ